MRRRIPLAALQEQWKTEQARESEHTYRETHKYDGLEDCRKNVVKCSCFKKLKYCVSTKEN